MGANGMPYYDADEYTRQLQESWLFNQGLRDISLGARRQPFPQRSIYPTAIPLGGMFPRDTTAHYGMPQVGPVSLGGMRRDDFSARLAQAMAAVSRRADYYSPMNQHGSEGLSWDFMGNDGPPIAGPLVGFQAAPRMAPRDVSADAWLGMAPRDTSFDGMPMSGMYPRDKSQDIRPTSMYPRDTSWDAALNARAHAGNPNNIHAGPGAPPTSLQDMMRLMFGAPPNAYPEGEPSSWSPPGSTAEKAEGGVDATSGGAPVVDARSMGLGGVLGNAFKEYNNNITGLLGEFDKMRQEAIGERDTMFGQIQQHVNQAPPQNDPIAEFAGRLAANIGDVLNPRQNSAQTTEQVMQQNLQGIKDQRAQQLSIMAEKYKRAADQAEKMGDTERALKLYAKGEGFLKQQEMLAQEKLGYAKLAQNERALRAGAGPGGTRREYAAPELAPMLAPIQTQVEQLAKTKEFNQTDSKGRKLRRRAANLQAQAQQIIEYHQRTGQVPATIPTMVDILDADVAQTLASAKKQGMPLQELRRRIQNRQWDDMEARGIDRGEFIRALVAAAKTQGFE